MLLVSQYHCAVMVPPLNAACCIAVTMLLCGQLFSSFVVEECFAFQFRRIAFTEEGKTEAFEMLRGRRSVRSAGGAVVGPSVGVAELYRGLAPLDDSNFLPTASCLVLRTA